MNPAPQPTRSGATDLLTLAEVRTYCRIGRTTLWRWINEQGLRTVSVLGIKRVRRRDLDEFLGRHSHETLGQTLQA
jgi:predicted DNA-binding transcriptional regulator AlpA